MALNSVPVLQAYFLQHNFYFLSVSDLYATTNCDDSKKKT